MSIIKVLDKHVANMIAAGEVVENPASVVKELVENAIDAHSSSVTVEIQNGGITYIRVTDDGKGMDRDDAKTAFLRHATSKISSAEDLSGIGTLGFRGEALAAISSVSRIDLITKAQDADMGSAIRVEAGEVIRESESGCPDGTTIIVRDLFFNTPARMRFLKKDATEAAAVENIIKYIALSHPEISIKFIKDGKDVLHTPGDGVVKSCMYALFGRDFANNMNEVRADEHGIKVEGFTCVPSASRGNRALQFFFVNGRCVKSRMLSVALDNAYKERLMKGRFPTCVLMLTLPLGQVDVNVHPAKTEVKFARERDVFDAVYFGVKSALENSERKVIAPSIPFIKQEPIDNITENQQSLSFSEKKKEENKGGFAFNKPAERNVGGFMPPIVAPKKTEASAEIGERSEGVLRSTYFPPYNNTPKEEIAKEPAVEVQVSEVEDEPLIVLDEKPIVVPVEEKEEASMPEKADKTFRFIGEAMNTYIIVEFEGSVVMIDKHAAHERIIFEKLRETCGNVQTQILLSPEIVDIDRAAAMALIDNKEEISKLGFEIDEFGDGSVAISAVPDGIDAHDAISVIDKLADNLKRGARAEMPEIMSETMYSVACKAAIKAGQKNTPEELIAIAERVLIKGDIHFCPHGRPVMVEFSKSELEKKFKRIV